MIKDKTIWQKTKYFEDFEEFDPSVAYVPSTLMDHLVHVNLSPEVEDTEDVLARPYMIIGAILKASFTPTDKYTPPPGYVRCYDEDKLSEITGLSTEIVSQQLQALLQLNIIAIQGDYLWVRDPENWSLPDINIDKEEDFARLGPLQLLRMLNLSN